MPIQAPSFQFDPRKLRERALFDNYGMQHPDDIDPGFTQEPQNPINDPGFEQNPFGGSANTDPGFNLDLPPAMGITPSNPRQDPFSPGNFSVKPPAGDPSPNYQDMMGQLGDFATPMQDKYQGLLNARPERERPGVMRSIVAAGMGLGEKDPSNAFKLQEDVMYAPYNREMADWTSQVEPAYRSAQLENTANANERQMRSSLLTNKTNMDRYEDMNNQATRRNDITEARNRDLKSVADKRNEIEAAWRAGYTFEKNGNQLWATRKDGSTFMVSENDDFSPLELERLRHRGDMEEIGKRTEGAVEVKKTPSGTPTGGSGNPVVQRNMRFQNVYDTATDEEKSFMIPPATTNGSWQFAKRPTKGLLTGSKDYAAKVAAYDALVARVNAGGAGAKAGPGANVAPPGATPPPAKATGGGLGPSTPPAPPKSEFVGPQQPPLGPEKFAPRQEYGGPKVPSTGDEVPWIAKPFQGIVNDIKHANEPGKLGGESGLPGKQVMTDNGPVVVPQGQTAVTDVQSGVVGFIPNENVAAAEASGRYKRVK